MYCNTYLFTTFRFINIYWTCWCSRSPDPTHHFRPRNGPVQFRPSAQSGPTFKPLDFDGPYAPSKCTLGILCLFYTGIWKSSFCHSGRNFSSPIKGKCYKMLKCYSLLYNWYLYFRKIYFWNKLVTTCVVLLN